MLKRYAAMLAVVGLALSVGAFTLGCEDRHEPQIPDQQMPAPREQPIEQEEMPRPQPDDQPLIPQQ